MFGKLRILVVIIGIFIQIGVIVLFGFTEAPISNYACMAVWSVCGVIIFRAVKVKKAI